MADKSVGELIAAQSVTPTDLFVLEQNGTAKKLTGQVLENWLVSFADGHGGIQSIEKLSTNILADTYRITLADTTTFDFVVNNGRGITDISKTSTSGLVDTYTISYNNGTTSTFTVKNGEKGDKGDNAYIWIKYASQEPTESSHSMGDLPDDWIGIYSGNASTAPTDWQQYKWYQIKGEKGDIGVPATLTSAVVTYQVGNSGTVVPSGDWSSSVPAVTQGQYLWTRTVIRFNSGSPVTSYSVSRFGIDGTGSVVTVSGVSPDSQGNVPLTSGDVGALALTGGVMSGPLSMNGQTLYGLNAPTTDDAATNRAYVDEGLSRIVNPNLLDNPWFQVNQRGESSYTGAVYGVDRWKSRSNNITVTVNSDGSLTIKNDGTSTAYFSQYIEDGALPAGKYTLSVNVLGATGTPNSDGDYAEAYISYGSEPSFSSVIGITSSSEKIYSIALNPSDKVVRVQFNIVKGCSITIKAVKLEIGSVSTLANDIPPGYGEQLARCQRYYQRIVNVNASEKALLGQAFATTDALASIALPLPAAMRSISAVSASGIQISPNISSNAIDVSSVDAVKSAFPYNTKSMNLGGTFTQGQVYSVWLAPSGYIELSADL